jgi:molybdate transport system ATP-binding protein
MKNLTEAKDLAATKNIAAAFNLVRNNFELDVDIEIPGCGVTALFGSSGSGKTTLLRCLAGLEKSTRGNLIIGDEVWQSDTDFMPPHKREIGYVFQDSNLFEHLNVNDNLRYGFNRIDKQQRRISIDQAVSLLGIESLLSAMPAQLSGGQKQRVAIARALLSSPNLLLMDEPLASLDLSSKAEILPYLDSINTALSIPMIYVSHSPDEVVRIADHMVLLEAGKVRAQGAVNELLTRTDLPLAHLNEASAVVSGKIKEHDQRYHLTYIHIADNDIATSIIGRDIGTEVRVRILARDVSIALQPESRSSISNVLPCTITELSATHDLAKVLVKLNLKNEQLLAHITAKSADTLGLKTGMSVYAQIKSVALMKS